MLSKAVSFIEDGSVDTSIKAADLSLDVDKSEKVLDKALTVMQEAKANNLISEDDLTAYESLALKKVAIDKASVASHAKTGVATTGAINVATNSIKKSVHDTLIDTDPTKVDIFRSIFDIPEQEAISSKKIISAYDDMRARDMTDILGEMFTSNNAKNYQLSKNDKVLFVGPFVEEKDSHLGAWSCKGRPEYVTSVYEALKDTLYYYKLLQASHLMTYY
jgi:hypothetical protein